MRKKENKKLNDNPRFPLGPENYKLMAVGFVIIVIGFLLMVGGGSKDPEVFNPEVFNFRRITLAPMVLLFGFIFQIYAIMKRTGSDKQD
jgi:membrane-bound ClpP family serine protease